MDRSEMANKLLSVINTLQGLDIKSTYDNMNRLLGCIQALDDIAQRLSENPVANVKKEEDEVQIEEFRVCGNKQ